MSSKRLHDREILLVEDQDQFYGPISRWLSESNYHVTLAKNLQEALNALDSNHFHLAIIDIRLVDDDDQNEDGLLVLEDIGDRNLHNDFPCIILTAYPSVENLLTATQMLGVDRYIQKKPGYRQELLKAVDDLFEEVVQINFDLDLNGSVEQFIPEVIIHDEWPNSSKQQMRLLDLQAKDLLGKLFRRAESIFITPLNPGFSGATVLQVRPTWEKGTGHPRIVKIGRIDKVQIEARRYEEFVEPYLPEQTVRLVDTVYSRAIGALHYTFAMEYQETLREFDEYYARQSSQEILGCFRNLIRDVCRNWYRERRGIHARIPDLYFDAFQLTEERLIDRIQLVLPRFDPVENTFQFEHVELSMTNPVAWLRKNKNHCVQEVFTSITHGDLTGRNIMVNTNGASTLIDFYRTCVSHILRDFVILETDIKYRLLEYPKWHDFCILEKNLLQRNSPHLSTEDSDISDSILKGYEVITGLRELAREVSTSFGAKPEDTRKEYLISLLMATLNVVRLRHIERGRKLNAMFSASLICSELDILFGQKPLLPNIDEICS